MTQHRLHNTVYARLEAIANAEKITKAELGALSRELLEYVVDTKDIGIVNRLVGVLTPVNRKAAILYFTHFLPWEVKKDDNDVFIAFGKMTIGEKKVTKKLQAIYEWLSDETNNIWVWSEANIEMNKKKDFAAQVARAISKALEGDEKSDTPALTMEQLMEAIFAGGVSVTDMLSAVSDKMPIIDAAFEEVNEPKSDIPLALQA